VQDFPANSAKARAQSEGPTPRPERVERVATAVDDRRKQGVGKKFKSTFINGTARMALDYVILEVVVPTIQDALIESVQGGFERLVRGETRTRRPTSSYSNLGHFNYQSISSGSSNRPPTSSPPRTLSRQSRARHDFDEIVIHSRAEAQDVLDQMFEWLSRYNVVRVDEFYDMTGIASNHTDHKWGWTSLPGAKVVRLRNNGGFVLDLPEPEELRA
jgi:hypothetical protein